MPTRKYLETRGCWPSLVGGADPQPWPWSEEVALGLPLVTPRQEGCAQALEFSLWGNS